MRSNDALLYPGTKPEPGSPGVLREVRRPLRCWKIDFEAGKPAEPSTFQDIFKTTDRQCYARKEMVMYEDMRVKYLFINLRYPAYVKWQSAIIVGCFVAAGLFFMFARGSGVWILSNAWWLCLIVGGLEILETVLALGKAKKDYMVDQQADAISQPDAPPESEGGEL